MKLNLENKTYESNFDPEGIDASIAPEQIKKLWEMLANPYKDNISSIVREITSNCFDAHKEANVDDAVIITFDKDESGVYIKFSDVGSGLSPERIKTIYINYLTSTKEDNNDFIGAFGIGSKSPLSYVDMFFIDTISEGIKYSYIMRKGDSAPRIEKIFETPITKRNGTDIKLYIQNKTRNSSDNLHLGDIGAFLVAIKNQLKYFDNVFVQSGPSLNFLGSTFINYIKDLNDFKIYQGDNFIYRTANINPVLSLCLGKVNYPIDYKLVFPEITNQFKLPIALKFEIGDLMVTYSREDVKYNQESIEKIRNKFKEAVKEILDKLKLQNKEPLEYLNLIDYANKRNAYVNNYFSLNLSDTDKLNVEEFVTNSYRLSVSHLTTKYNINDYLSGIDNLRSRMDDYNEPEILFESIVGYKKYIDSFNLLIPYLKPLKGTTINTSTHLFFSNYQMYKYRGRNNISFSSGKARGNEHVTRNSLINFLNKRDAKSIIFINDVSNDLVIGKKITTYMEQECDVKGKEIVILSIYKKLQVYKNILDLDEKLYKNKSEWRNNIKMLQSLFENEFEKKVIYLSSIVSKATDEWYNKYKKDNGLTNTTVKKVVDKAKITLKSYTLSKFNLYSFNLFASHRSLEGMPYSMSEVTLEFVKNNKDKFVFFTREDFIKAGNVYDLYMKSTNLVKSFNSKEFCLISKQAVKQLENEKIMYSLDDLVKDNKEELIKLYYYTKYISTLSIKDSVQYRDRFITEEELSKALVLYYLMGNDFISKAASNNIFLQNLIRKLNYLEEQKTSKKIILDEYKNILETVFVNSSLDFDVECKLLETQYLKDVKDYSDMLDKEYKYLNLVVSHTNVASSEKDHKIFFQNKIDLIDELGLIKKDSFFDKCKLTNQTEIVIAIKELRKTDMVLDSYLKPAMDLNYSFGIGNFITTVAGDYVSNTQKYTNHLSFYISNYVKYKKVKP